MNALEKYLIPFAKPPLSTSMGLISPENSVKYEIKVSERKALNE